MVRNYESRVALALVATACCRPLGSSSTEQKEPTPMKHPTQVTRIQSPATLDAKTGGATSVAQRGADGAIIVGFRTDSGAAIAKLNGQGVTALLAGGEVSPRSHGVLFRQDGDQLHVVGLEGGDVLAPPNLLTGSDLTRASAEIVGNSAVVLTPNSPMLHFISDGKTVWSVGGGSDGTPYVSGYAVQPKTGIVYVAVTAADRKSAFLTARSTDGRELWRTDLQGRAGRVLVNAQEPHDVAVLLSAPSRCETCIDAVVLEAATGKKRSAIALDNESFAASLDDRSSDGTESAGFEHGLLWFYAWRREQYSDMGGGHLPEKCWYAVYDPTRGSKARLSRETSPCVRAMIQVDDGSVVTLDATDDKTLTARLYDGAP